MVVTVKLSLVHVAVIFTIGISSSHVAGQTRIVNRYPQGPGGYDVSPSGSSHFGIQLYNQGSIGNNLGGGYSTVNTHAGGSRPHSNQLSVFQPYISNVGGGYPSGTVTHQNLVGRYPTGSTGTQIGGNRPHGTYVGGGNPHGSNVVGNRPFGTASHQSLGHGYATGGTHVGGHRPHGTHAGGKPFGTGMGHPFGTGAHQNLVAGHFTGNHGYGGHSSFGGFNGAFTNNIYHGGFGSTGSHYGFSPCKYFCRTFIGQYICCQRPFQFNNW